MFCDWIVEDKGQLLRIKANEKRSMPKANEKRSMPNNPTDLS